MPGLPEGTMSRLPEEETGLRSGNVSQCCPHRSQTVPHDRFLKKLYLSKGHWDPGGGLVSGAVPWAVGLGWSLSVSGAVFSCLLSNKEAGSSAWAAVTVLQTGAYTQQTSVSQGPGGPRSGLF